MEKGSRVRVVRGRRALGATGVVFWVGANKYGPGMRLGIHDEQGKTLWIDLDHVEVLEATPESPEQHLAEELARRASDERQIAAEIAHEEQHPVRLVPWHGAIPPAACYRAEHEARRQAALEELGGAFGASILDVARLSAERRAILTVDKLLLVDQANEVLDRASVKRDEIEPVFGGRALVVYGDYGEPMLYGVAQDRLKRLASSRARVDHARVLDGHLLFEAHGRYYELFGALDAIEAFEASAPKKRRPRRTRPPAVSEEPFSETPSGVWSPWRLNDETGRFPGHPRLARAASGRIAAAWDPRKDLEGDLPRRTCLGFSDAPGHLSEITDSFAPHLDRSISELALDPTGRFLFVQGHRTISRMDLETGEVEVVHPKVPSFHPHSGDCLVLFLGNALVWLERRHSAWVEGVRIKTAKADTAIHDAELDCTFLFGTGSSKVQAFARIGDRAKRLWTSKSPYIRAAFRERNVYLYQHALSGARLVGFSELAAHARSSK